MGNFNKGSKSGFRGGKSFGGGRDGKRGGFGGGRHTSMYKVECSECGNMAEVPFRPTGDKPVLCDNCFGSKKDRGFQSRNFDKRFENREPFGMKKHPDTGSFGPKKRLEKNTGENIIASLSKEDVEKVVSELHTKIDRLTQIIEGFAVKGLEKVATAAESASKKLEAKAVPKKEVAKPAAKPAAKKVVAKKAPAPKKVAAKAVAPKKVAKKVASKTVKKVAKKSSK